MDWFSRIGGRKFAITMICLALGVIIDLNTARGLSENLLYLMLGIIGVFVSGNVIAKFPGPRGQSFDLSGKSDAANPAEIAELRMQLGELQTSVSELDEGAGSALIEISKGIENNQKLLAALVSKPNASQ